MKNKKRCLTEPPFARDFRCLAALRLKGTLLRVSEGCLNILRYCGCNYIREIQHNHLQGCGEQTSYANALLFCIIIH